MGFQHLRPMEHLHTYIYIYECIHAPALALARSVSLDKRVHDKKFM